MLRRLVGASAGVCAALAVGVPTASAGLIVVPVTGSDTYRYVHLEFKVKHGTANFAFIAGDMQGYPSAASADLSWDLEWSLDGSPNEYLATTPMGVYGTATQVASKYPGGYPSCSSPVSVNNLSPQKLVSMPDTKTGEVYGLAEPLELGLAVKTCYGLGTGWFAVGTYNPPVCASYGTAQMMDVPPSTEPVVDTQPIDCNYTHNPLITDDSRFTITIKWKGTVTVTYPASAGGYRFNLPGRVGNLIPAKVLVVIIRARKAATSKSSFRALSRRGSVSLKIASTLGRGIRSLTVTLSTKRAVLARGTIARGHGRRLRFALTRAGRRALRARRTTATLTATALLAGGRTLTSLARVRITP